MSESNLSLGTILYEIFCCIPQTSEFFPVENWHSLIEISLSLHNIKLLLVDSRTTKSM